MGISARILKCSLVSLKNFQHENKLHKMVSSTTCSFLATYQYILPTYFTPSQTLQH